MTATRRDLLRWLDDLGWRDPPHVAAPAAAQVTVARGPTDCTTLEELEALLDGCTRCDLAEKRRHIVFGEGNPHAAVMFVGEAPGADEDRTGRPFVGQAGKLLDAMIVAMGLRREDVYIANVVKCRPPGNRDPKEPEKAACAPFLDRQIELIRPRVLVALGKPAANRLSGTSKPIGALRGRWLTYRGIPLLATYHPAYLLRNVHGKRAVWEDLKRVLARLSRT
ncbi:MAG: uracil-DNA glycosylase [Acidobacteria bacterium]|nr:uracil-DNA glycosylase [Acidobacteriota bacterium]